MRLIDYPRRNKRGVRRWLPSWKLVVATSMTVVTGLVAGFMVAVATVAIPEPNKDALQQATIFTYADASTQITHVGTNRRPVTLDQIPLVVRQAVLAAEDRTYYSDPGVSPMGLLRALKNDVTSGGDGNLQGGSTITQQFVKNYYLTQHQTLSRKLNEVLVALKLDHVKSKDSILVDDLNTIFFARGAYGIESATLAYFGLDVSQLTDPAKAAYIAAIIQSPYVLRHRRQGPGRREGVAGQVEVRAGRHGHRARDLGAATGLDAVPDADHVRTGRHGRHERLHG